MHTLEYVNDYLGTVGLSLANFSWHAAWTLRSSQLHEVPWLWDSKFMKKRHYFYMGLFKGRPPQSAIWSWALPFGYFCFIVWQKGRKSASGAAFLLTLSKFNINGICYSFYLMTWREKSFSVRHTGKSVFSYQRAKSCSLKNRSRKVWEKSFTAGHWRNFS